MVRDAKCPSWVELTHYDLAAFSRSYRLGRIEKVCDTLDLWQSQQSGDRA